ncbi:MAG: VWA domain-containing protein, partial [Planctomycetota bacterium]|nr:VWA domain-containing protein [Planctomycetota bacterium]
EKKPETKRGDATRYAKKKKEPAYYGIKIFAKSVGYVLDTSLSMEQGFYVPPNIQKRLGRSYTAKTRIGVCKQELEQSIRELDPRARFNVIFFDHGVRAWKDTAVPASPSAKSTAISKIKAITPAGQTNYYDALRLTLGMEGRDGGWRSAFADTPDTLFFLTDGTPTDGEITKADELLSWWHERNRFARLRVHVIAMGITNVDVEFLRRFAESSSGTFVHLKGKY